MEQGRLTIFLTEKKTNTQGTNEADNYACKQAPS